MASGIDKSSLPSEEAGSVQNKTLQSEKEKCRHCYQSYVRIVPHILKRHEDRMHDEIREVMGHFCADAQLDLPEGIVEKNTYVFKVRWNKDKDNIVYVSAQKICGLPKFRQYIQKLNRGPCTDIIDKENVDTILSQFFPTIESDNSLKRVEKPKRSRTAVPPPRVEAKRARKARSSFSDDIEILETPQQRPASFSDILKTIDINTDNYDKAAAPSRSRQQNSEKREKQRQTSTNIPQFHFNRAALVNNPYIITPASAVNYSGNNNYALNYSPSVMDVTGNNNINFQPRDQDLYTAPSATANITESAIPLPDFHRLPRAEALKENTTPEYSNNNNKRIQRPRKRKGSNSADGSIQQNIDMLQSMLDSGTPFAPSSPQSPSSTTSKYIHQRQTDENRNALPQNYPSPSSQNGSPPMIQLQEPSSVASTVVSAHSPVNQHSNASEDHNSVEANHQHRSEAKKPKIESNKKDGETYFFDHPSASILEKVCKKMEIEYDHSAYKFWGDIIFRKIVSTSENIKTHSLKSRNIFACFSQFFTGKSDSCFLFQHIINSAFRKELIESGEKSIAEVDEILFNTTVPDNKHMEFIAKFLSCRIGIYKNGILKKFGKWEIESDALSLILLFENGFFSVVLDL